jgi:hypothetical protein
MLICIPEYSYTVTYGNDITLDCIITSIPELQNVSWKMETNGILYDIDTTNTFKYEGSTVASDSLPVACPLSVVLSGYSAFFHH